MRLAGQDVTAGSPDLPALTATQPSRALNGDYAASRDRERSREYFSRLITSDVANGNSAVPDPGGNSTIDGQQKRCDSSIAFNARVITDLPSRDPDGRSAFKRSINGRSADRRRRSTLRLPLVDEVNR